MLIHSLENLIRIRLVPSPTGVHLIAAARSTAEPGERATDENAMGIRWLAFELDRLGPSARRVANSWVESSANFRDFDVVVSGKQCLWVLETNLSLGALTLHQAAWTTPQAAVPPAGESLVANLPRARSTELQAGPAWHAQLAPHLWLFNPRAARHPRGGWLVTANTVDGRQISLRGPQPLPPGTPDPPSNEELGQCWKEETFVPARLWPVVLPDVEPPLAAFIKAPLAGNMFWSLRRYGGPEPTGSLWLASGSADPIELCKTLRLGPVRAFDLDALNPQRLGLAVLHSNESQTLIAVYQSRDGGRQWSAVASQSVDDTADRLALKAVDDGLYVAYSLTEGDFSLLKLLVASWRG